MSTSFIKCIKYNSNLDGASQTFQTCEAIIELSKDYKRLIITNRLPKRGTDYTNEHDPFKLEQVKQEEFFKL